MSAHVISLKQWKQDHQSPPITYVDVYFFWFRFFWGIR